MPRVSKVELGMECTIPTANYENYRPSVRVTVEVAPEDELTEAIKLGWDLVESEIRTQVMDLQEFRARRAAQKKD